MNRRYSQQIDSLYQQMYSMLFEYARSSLSNDALAEEAVQDTFAIACQKAEALCESTNPKGWLVVTLKHVISNTIRSQNTAARILADYLTLNASDLIATHDRLDLETLYGDIAETEEFRLLKEMALDGRSYLEMAQDRKINVDTCRKRMQRAKEFLQKKLKKQVTC